MRVFIAIVIILFAHIACSKNTRKITPNTEEHRQQIKKQETAMSAEAQKRKMDSIAILKAEKVPFIEHLPPIEIEAESVRRTTEEVAMRAMVLYVVAAKGHGIEQKNIEKLINDYNLNDAFTPNEKRFINTLNPSAQELAQFSWRAECYWVLLWALNYVDKLERPEKSCDIPPAFSLFLGTRDGFLKKAHLRPQSEILNAADLIYRYHWATTEARLNNQQPPAGLNGDVVIERHYVLNWLIGYMNEGWDDISTDT